MRRQPLDVSMMASLISAVFAWYIDNLNMNYEKQAIDFLESTGTSLSIVEAVPQKNPLWCKEGEKHGAHYSVTLKNKRHSYTFDFWDSIHNKEFKEKFLFGSIAEKYNILRDLRIERGRWNLYVSDYGTQRKDEILQFLKPSAYDIIACIGILYDDTFEDFCSSYGYETDSRKALKTWHACLEQDRHIRKLFSSEEIEILSKIQ